MISPVIDVQDKTQIKRIAIASPDETLLERLARLLKEVGHGVVSTQRSGRLLYRVLEDPFDLVVLDLDVEDLTGMEALQILRRARPDLPVVVLSGLLREREERQLAGEGIVGWVRKPVDANGLREILALVGDGSGEGEEVT